MEYFFISEEWEWWRGVRRVNHIASKASFQDDQFLIWEVTELPVHVGVGSWLWTGPHVPEAPQHLRPPGIGRQRHRDISIYTYRPIYLYITEETERGEPEEKKKNNEILAVFFSGRGQQVTTIFFIKTFLYFPNVHS